MARTTPVSTGTGRELHSDDLTLRQPDVLAMDADDSALHGPESIETEADPAILAKDYADAIAFMEEKVLIRIEPGRDEFEASHKDYTVNGRSVWVRVGVPTWVRRKYVEVMARNIHADVRTDVRELNDERNTVLNNVVRRNRPVTSFSVMRDSDKGYAWLQKVRNETV